MEMLKNKTVNVKPVKQAFSKNFPNSSILQTLLSMPDEVEIGELIGVVGVWLNILDMERANNLKGGK